MAGVRKTGTAGKNNLIGGAGDDTLDGLAGNDTLVGNSGADLLIGGDGNDSLVGGDGNDTLIGGAGADTLKGGLGNDTYVVGSGDILSDTGGIDTVESNISWTLGESFENLTLTGTSGASATGNSLNNIITGNSGNDTMFGGAGNDTFKMANGATGSYGVDAIDGDTGIDTIDYGVNALSAIFVDLAAATASGGGTAGAGTATLVSIENVVGGGFDDVITGDSAANALFGGAGNDTLNGGAGNDWLDAGTGADRYVFSVAPGSANADTVVGFIAGTDAVVLDGTVHADSGPTGNLRIGDARFFAGAGAISGQDPTDRVVYDTATGELYYDADGSGAGEAQRIATLQGAPALAATDIAIINGSSTGGGAVIDGTSGNNSLVGGAGNDTIDGQAGDDAIDGFAGDDLLLGGPGHDTLNGGAGNDSIFGGDGTDTYVFGGDYGNDQVDGGTGQDFIAPFANDSGIVVDLRAGTLIGGGISGSGSATLANIEGVFGTSFADHMTAADTGSRLDGADGNDTLIGGLGNDFLLGRAGANALFGGAGNDTLLGGPGSDWLDGGSGNDIIYLTHVNEINGEDTVDGGSGFDTLVLDWGPVFVDLTAGIQSGGNNSGDGITTLFSIESVMASWAGDRLIGSNGADHFDGDQGNDSISGLGGNDTLIGGWGNDTVEGGAGDDSLWGGQSINAIPDGHDQLFGGEGNDDLADPGGENVLSGGTGNDTLTGGVDSDIYAFSVAPGTANADFITQFVPNHDFIRLDSAFHADLGATGNFVTADERFFAASFSAPDAVAAAHDSTDRVIYDESSGKLYYDADGTGAAPLELIATLQGAQGAPRITASDIAVDIVGGFQLATVGDDTLTGGAGNDTLDGLAGNDSLVGNGRADLLIGGDGSDTVHGNDGDDTLLGGSGNDSLTGNLGLDLMIGGDGNDTLDGGFGDSEEWPGDTLEGGLGDDAYYVQAGDEIREKADEGIDSVYADMWQYALGANLENLTFSPIALSSSDGFNFAYVSIDYMGNELDNFISSGHSLMTWVPSEERDVIAGGAGNDTLYGGWGTSWLQGGAGADALYGTSGNDALEGGEGNDTLAGSVDNDSLTGGAGNDSFVFDASPSAANADSITDFVSGTDKLQLDDAAHANIGALGNFTVDDPRYWAEAGATSGHDVDDRVIYDTSTGAIYYDSNGDADGASQPVATLSGAPSLTAADIMVI